MYYYYIKHGPQTVVFSLRRSDYGHVYVIVCVTERENRHMQLYH